MLAAILPFEVPRAEIPYPLEPPGPTPPILTEEAVTTGGVKHTAKVRMGEEGFQLLLIAGSVLALAEVSPLVEFIALPTDKPWGVAIGLPTTIKDELPVNISLPRPVPVPTNNPFRPELIQLYGFTLSVLSGNMFRKLSNSVRRKPVYAI
jgi:hypothetical protein